MTTPPQQLPADPLIGAVVIGRNEGERLERCLRSLRGRVTRIVYVDSGSTDGSVERARLLDADVVTLDPGVPFTAARARNAGLARLLELDPGAELVQFVDGDCEVAEGWLHAATALLARRPRVAAVAGRRRERCPDASIYNRLCDLEWDTPIGDAKACGGDVLMRVEALQRAGGYRDSMIAGEEPELCVRLRAEGWQVCRLNAEMTLHDACIHRFGQWWRRQVRAGHAFAEGAWLHGRAPERHNVRPLVSALAWGLALPLLVIGLAAAAWPYGLLALLAYPVQFVRVRRRERRRGRSRRHAALYAAFTLIGKPAQAHGAIRFALGLLSGRRVRLIEYKRVPRVIPRAAEA